MIILAIEKILHFIICGGNVQKRKEYLKKIQNKMKETLQINFPCVPELYLLNTLNILDGQSEKIYGKVLLYIIIAARIVYARE